MSKPIIPLYNPDMTEFEGRDVIQSAVAVTNAGDGLSQALMVEPGELTLGKKVYVVLEAEVTKVRYEGIKDTDCLRRVHTLKTHTATFADGDEVARLIDAQRRKVEKAQGIERLPLDEFDGNVVDIAGGDQ